MPQANPLPNIDSTEQVQTITMDFGVNYLPVGVTLTGSPTVTLAVVSGVDAAPATRLSGAPIIGTAPAPKGSGRLNCAVLQQVKLVQDGVQYLIKAWCPRSDGDVAELWTYFNGEKPA